MTTTTFAEHQHPRGTGGRFTTKGHSEAELELTEPATSPVYAVKRSAPHYDIDGSTSVRYDSPDFPAGVSRVEVRIENGATHLSVMRELTSARIAPAGVDDPKEWVAVRSDEIQELLTDRTGTDGAALSGWRGRTSIKHRTILTGGDPDPETISARVNAATDGKLEDYLGECLAVNVEPDTETGAAVADRIGITGVQEAQHEALGRIERLHGPVKQMGNNSLAEVLEVQFTSRQLRDQEVSVHLIPEGEYRRAWIGEFRRGDTTGISVHDIAPRAWPLR
ncbi:hypothetical protein [Kocuria arenosa]|uniref:hypothetical protein n=1 Tax=Kocuria arenosa TaxID=3071446 RepID=UPI0034D66D1D